MFGMDVSELMVLLVVGIVVVGPKRLPELMRKAGGYVAKLRRLSTNLRAQSGIDRILREEGLDKEIRELRALKESLSKQAMLDGLVNAVNKPAAPARPLPARPLPASKPAPALPAASTDAASNDAGLKDEATTKDDTAKSDSLPSTEPAAENAAAGLIKPAEGVVARDASPPPAAAPAPAVANAYRSFRAREYPPYGPDHYEAMPDDLEEDDHEAGVEPEAAAEPEPAAEPSAASEAAS
jgi:sec-independent protein translocase protein TatB